MQRPIYDVYVFHATNEGSCNLVKHAKALIYVSLGIDKKKYFECPELNDES